MPIGIKRLNDPHPQPSSQIVFIKALPGPSAPFATDFLERIAAICHPVMKSNHLSVMTLEEHEPNPEFIGRNFNAGEIIQLVLKAPYSGHWLSFRSVQMVMMHELAHCVQMNHSGAFWKVNNQYKGELRELWAKGYTGDGLWGRGRTLLSGQYDNGRLVENEILPRNLCGGSFRSSRRRKRKRVGAGGPGEKMAVTYAERQQRRIAKKFGVNGVALGDDEETKIKLEKGQKVKGKPRVANSSRGRELRVAAALARFGQQKEEAKEEFSATTESEVGESGGESDYEEAEDENQAFDLDGTRMRDAQGRGFVNVCEGEDQNDVHVKQEMTELQELDNFRSTVHQDDHLQHIQDESASPAKDLDQKKHHTSLVKSKIIQKDAPEDIDPRPTIPAKRESKQIQLPESSNAPKGPTETFSQAPDLSCPICSMLNEPSSLLCIACSHVLNTNKVTRTFFQPDQELTGYEPSNVAANSTSSKDWTVWVGIGALCSSLTLAFYFSTMAVFDIVITTRTQPRWTYLLGYAILATAYLASVLLSYLRTRNSQIYLVSVASVIMVPLSFFGSLTTSLYLPIAFATGFLPSAVMHFIFVGLSVVSALALTLYTFYRLMQQVGHNKAGNVDFVLGAYFLLLHLLAALLYYKFKFDPQGTTKPIWTDPFG